MYYLHEYNNIFICYIFECDTTENVNDSLYHDKNWSEAINLLKNQITNLLVKKT